MDEIRKQRNELLGVHTHLTEWRATAPQKLVPLLDKQIKKIEVDLRKVARQTRPVYNERRAIGSGIIAYGDLDS